MDQLTLTTPALLFSAISLILLAYTNRFLGYANLIRELYAKFKVNREKVMLKQIENLRKRLYLTRAMQTFGVISLFFCVAAMFLIFYGFNKLAPHVFGFGMVCLIVSLAISIYEIHISVKALEFHLDDMKKEEEAD